MSYRCVSCGKEMNDNFEIKGMPGVGGNCGNCGNLCAKCAGKWSDDGYCEYCAMSLEDLEYTLPLTVMRYEKKEMPCPSCAKEIMDYVRYEQRIYRYDSFFNEIKTRNYEIFYRK